MENSNFRNSLNKLSQEKTTDQVIPFIAIALITILVAAVPLLFLDPKDNNGFAFMFGVIATPTLASVAIIQVLVQNLGAIHFSKQAAIWVFAVLPIGILLCCIPGFIQNPKYFTADTFWGFVGSLLMMAILIYVGLLLGVLVWFFFVLPINLTVAAIKDIIDGKPFKLSMFFAPALLFILAAIILVGGFTLDDLKPGRFASGDIISALFGVPGDYTVIWPEGLWIVRGLVAILVLFWIWGSQSSKKAAKQSLENPDA